MISSSKNIEIRRFETWADCVPFQDQWNQIVIQAGKSKAVPSVFQTYQWNNAWWQIFGSDFQLLLLGAFQDQKLVGIAPLMIRKKGFLIPTHVISFIGSSNYSSDYCSFIYPPEKPEIVTAMIAWIQEHKNLWDEVDFMNLLDETPEFNLLKESFSKGFCKTEPEYLYDAPTRILGTPEENDELVNRKSLKRHFNGFKKMGALTYQHLENATLIQERLNDFFQQHIGRREAADDQSMFLDERQKRFYHLVVEELMPTGWLRFFAVDVDGKAVAYHLGFEFLKKFYWYKPTFDAKYLKKSPGEVLLKTLFEDAIARGLKEFDFTVGNEGFKYRFSNHVRKVYRYRVFNSLPHYFLFRVKQCIRSVAKRIIASVSQKNTSQ